MATASAILWLRRIASCFFFTLAILFAVLWVRSYLGTGSLVGSTRHTWNTLMETSPGVLWVRKYETLGFERYRLFSYAPTPPPNRLTWGFLWMKGVGMIDDKPITITDLTFPLWLPAVIATLLAVAIRPAPRFKFSLRDLLTLTTVAAVTIGPLAFWLRSIG